MKRLFIATVLCIVFAFNANAQLKPPTITHRDTLVISSTRYNNGVLDYNDFPAHIIEETPVALYIAGEMYKKGSPTYTDLNKYVSSWEGHVDYYDFGNATVNGKKAQVAIIRPREDCNTETMKFVIDDFIFYAEPLAEFAKQMDWSIEYARFVINELENRKKAERQ